MPATSDATIAAQLDHLTTMIDGVLKANAAQAGGQVSMDRAMLEQIKSELDQIKQNLKKP